MKILKFFTKLFYKNIRDIFVVYEKFAWRRREEIFVLSKEAFVTK